MCRGKFRALFGRGSALENYSGQLRRCAVTILPYAATLAGAKKSIRVVNQFFSRLPELNR